MGRVNNRSQENIELEGYVLTESTKGWKIHFIGTPSAEGYTICWMPKSQIEIEDASNPELLQVIEVPQWLAEEKELI